MPEAAEALVLDGLHLNDEETWVLESLTFKGAEKKPAWVSNPDADGDTLVEEPHYTNAFFEATVRVVPAADTDAALALIGELLDKLQDCSRAEEGLALKWTPNNASTTYTWYAVLGEVTDLPITLSGEMAGWFLESPVLGLKITCRPFGEASERTIKSATESSAAPLQELLVGGVEGDVPARARLILKDKSSQNRRYAAWGRDTVKSESPPACLITAASLSVTGYSGEAKTLAGAYSEEKTKRAVAAPSPTTVAAATALEHVGSFAVYMRVYSRSEESRFRLSYRNGDGPVIPLKWKASPVTEVWGDIYLGEVFLARARLGAQQSEIRLEHKAASGFPANDINFLTLLPTKAGAISRGLANENPTKLLAYDYFQQSEGALTGKKLGGPGEITWAGAGDSDDFTVITADDVARRTATSDSSVSAGRFVLAGSAEPGGIRVGATISTSLTADGAQRFGIFARYTGSGERWFMAAITNPTAPEFSSHQQWLQVFKCTSSLVATVASAPWTNSSTLSSARVELQIDPLGFWTVWVYQDGSPTEALLSGYDSSLAVGGAHEKGKFGIYDGWTSASANTRNYSKFTSFEIPSPGVVCYSGKSIEVGYKDTLREAESGSAWGPPDLTRGASVYLEPAGNASTINRIVTRMRRGDIAEEEDAAVTDKHTTEIKVTERFLMPR